MKNSQIFVGDDAHIVPIFVYNVCIDTASFYILIKKSAIASAVTDINGNAASKNPDIIW